MKIWVNREEQQYDAQMTLMQLLEFLKKSEKPGIAVAVNNRVISKTNWDSHKLNNHDKITIITATQGG
jgi:sulfur carrier protein